MSKRLPKFKITFKKVKDTNEKPVTEIKVNGDVVGHIFPPAHDTHAPEKHHITILMRVIGQVSPKTLKPVFDKDKDARDYIEENLYDIHAKNHLYMENAPKEKLPKRARFAEDYLEGI